MRLDQELELIGKGFSEVFTSAASMKNSLQGWTYLYEYEGMNIKVEHTLINKIINKNMLNRRRRRKKNNLLSAQ